MNTATADMTYEILCDIGRDYSESLDTFRWKIGDIGNLVMELYSDRSIEEFAKDINQRKSTVYQYSKMSKFYGVDIRDRLKEELPNLSYSHLREGLRIADTCTPDVIAWLEEVSANGYTADEASRKLTERLGHATRESVEGYVMGNYDTQGDEYIIKIRVDKEGFNYLKEIHSVMIRAK